MFHSNRPSELIVSGSTSIRRKRLWLALFAFMALGGLIFSGSAVSVESSGSKSLAAGNEVLASPLNAGLTVDASITVEAAGPAANLMSPVPATVSDSILLTDPTFVRPSAGAITSCPPTGNPTVHYKLYEFNISGCVAAAPVTIDTCASGAGLDTNVFVYRKSDGSPSTALSPTFSSGSPCTNVIASNNNNATACGAGTLLSSITTPLSDGNIVVVVTTNGANQTGNFTLSVTSGTCVVTQVPTCNPSISPTSDSYLAAGGTGTASVTIGAGCAWTAVSNDSFIHVTSGSAGIGNGAVNYSVDPNSGAARVGTMTIAGQTFNVTQEAGAVSLPCIHDALVNGNPTYTRPSVSGAGVVSCPATGNPTTRYKAYEFELAGCPSALVNVNTCANGVCAGPVTLADTQVTLYRKSDGSGSSPGSEIFNPASPCTNVIIGNNNSAVCGAGSTLSSFNQTVAAGRFVVVVTSTSAGDIGTFRLNVSTASPGCTITLSPTCPSITGTVTPTNQTICPGGSGNINVSVSGGTGPYTVSLNNGGGSQNGNGPFNFTVSPSSTTTYTATGSDANGCPITMSGTATVTVGDTTPPTVTCPANSSASADANCQAAVPDYASAATASDNCTASGSITKTQSPAAGTMVGAGPHTVTVTATDGAGNSSTCTTTFTVNDTTPPAVTCPANSSASADANCQAAVPNYAAAATASDNCTASGSITKTQSPAAGTMVGAGPHTVTVTATDGAGNSSTCTTTFTVNDTTPPAVTCPANSSASADANCQAAVPNYAAAATASDNCTASGSITKTQSPAAGTMVGRGPHTVTVTATDAAGNSSTCTTTFTVNDTTPPVITCPSNITVPAAPGTCAANVNPGVATATDNCSPPPTVAATRSDGKPLTDPYPVGTTTITWTATDSSNNQSSCTQTVTVTDTQAPVINTNGQTPSLWPPNHSYHTFQVTDFVTSVTDNCGGGSIPVSSVVITKVTSDEVENGNGDGNTMNDIIIAANCKSVQLRSEREGSGNGRVYTIFFKVTDAAGNVGTATTTVVVPKSQNGNPAVDSGPHYTVMSACP